MPHQVRHDLPSPCHPRASEARPGDPSFNECRHGCRITSCMASPLLVILGLDPGIHGFSCFSQWMPHRVRHDFRGIGCHFTSSLTPFSQSSSSMAPSLSVILGLDPGIHGFSCFSQWMPHRVRHDSPPTATAIPYSPLPTTHLPFPFEVKRPCPKKMVDFYMLQYLQSPAPGTHVLLQKQQFAPNRPSYRPGW